MGGVTILICMPLVGVLIGKMDPRYLVVFGFLSLAASMFYSTGLDLQMSFGYAATLRAY